MARNQFSRVATASLNACVVVPGIFAATLPVQPMGTNTVGRMIRCQLSRAVVRLEMSYQVETDRARTLGGAPVTSRVNSGASPMVGDWPYNRTPPPRKAVTRMRN